MTREENGWRFEAEPSGLAVWEQEVKYRTINCLVEDDTFVPPCHGCNGSSVTELLYAPTEPEQREEDVRLSCGRLTMNLRISHAPAGISAKHTAIY